jgi:hypothetical protein
MVGAEVGVVVVCVLVIVLLLIGSLLLNSPHTIIPSHQGLLLKYSSVCFDGKDSPEVS